MMFRQTPTITHSITPEADAGIEGGQDLSSFGMSELLDFSGIPLWA